MNTFLQWKFINVQKLGLPQWFLTGVPCHTCAADLLGTSQKLKKISLLLSPISSTIFDVISLIISFFIRS